jgi:hypothetical protein
MAPCASRIRQPTFAAAGAEYMCIENHPYDGTIIALNEIPARSAARLRLASPNGIHGRE